jgi:dinuclear metal center YbgI/SA1388 family protein
MSSPAASPRPLPLADLAAYLDELLDAGRGRDFGPNGLQVEGRPEVRKVVTGVSACRELFVRAHEAGADTVLVHHGLFWEWMPRQLTSLHFARVAELVRSGMSLLAYHLPLDRHAGLGNNAVAARRFGLVELEPFAEYQGLAVGFKGRFPEPVSPERLVELCREVYGQEPLAFLSGPSAVETLGIVSGGAQKELYDAIAVRLDAYLTGEVSEWVMNVAREAGIHYLAAGHYATERLGVQVLGDHLREKFGLEVEFIDVPNPV